MINIEDFKQMTDKEKCDLINKQFENCNTKNFKSGEISFTWSQAEKILETTSISKIDKKYMTSEEAMLYLQKKQELVEELDNEEIKKVRQLLNDEVFGKLLKLASNYNYIFDYIIKEDKKIKIRETSDEVITTSTRLYKTTSERWKAFTKKQKYNAVDIMNTALLEFMDKYE